jgi:hypothetical protein
VQEECSLVVLCSMDSMDKDMPHGMDTTIYLVPKVATAPGSRSSKRTRREETESVRAEEKLMEKVYADSHRLRECSKYFEACMNERWARSKPTPSQLEFHLELQADVVYYRDCFSRMEPRSFFQPIPSVDHCLELLKVASQIVFQEVVDLGIKYLSATPWSVDDEVKIRRFCESGQISLDSEAHGDLIERLRKSLREKTHGEVLSLYLEQAFSVWATPENRRVSGKKFQNIVSGPNRHAVIESMKKEATRLLLSFKKSNDNIEGFAWLYGLLQSVHAAQSIVDLLLKDRDIFESIYKRFEEDLRKWREKKYMVWIKLTAAMLQDVLDGCLFLTSLERRTLFIGWLETFGISMGSSDVRKDRDLRKLLTTFLMTFPFQEQMNVMESWKDIGEFSEVMNEVNGKWMMCLVNDLASRRGQEVTIADSREPADSAE